jgi:hypothetical protein
METGSVAAYHAVIGLRRRPTLAAADRCAHEIVGFLGRSSMRLRRLNGKPLDGNHQASHYTKNYKHLSCKQF